ncbi:phasin family protein [Methylosinus sp. H3A]|uniref:phasin family protein n=1 Tax=Methylosinus sp. H3A TaxID=2785786 RepID=UPI0018C319A4|nr:phasin family protein [Methylosinus sp. H3A]MBG0811896.1 phasin family protein [Methylosinus sp. H3A]
MATHTRGSSKRPPAPTPKEPPITLKDALDDDEPEAAQQQPAPPAEIEAVAAALEPVEVALSAAEPIVETFLETVAEPAPETPILETVAEPAVEPPLAPVTIVAAKIETSVAKPALPLDPSLWPLKTIDLVNENTAAVFDLALALGQARSMGDALEAQSRFASERYSTFVKRANEFVELSSRWSPFRFAVSAFVA